MFCTDAGTFSISFAHGHMAMGFFWCIRNDGLLAGESKPCGLPLGVVSPKPLIVILTGRESGLVKLMGLPKT